MVDVINCAKVNVFAKGKLEEGFSKAMVRAAVDERSARSRLGGSTRSCVRGETVPF